MTRRHVSYDLRVTWLMNMWVARDFDTDVTILRADARNFYACVIQMDRLMDVWYSCRDGSGAKRVCKPRTSRCERSQTEREREREKEREKERERSRERAGEGTGGGGRERKGERECECVCTGENNKETSHHERERMKVWASTRARERE